MRVDEQKLHWTRRLSPNNAVARCFGRVIPSPCEVLALHAQKLGNAVAAVAELDILLVEHAQF